MKTLLIIIGVVVAIFIFTQVMAKIQSNKIEMYPYKVAETYPNFEIRNYEAATFSYVVLDDTSYNSGSSNGFQKLGGYIFGANEKDQKIAMTSPVVMEMEETMTMKFLVPAEYDIDKLPIPKNAAVKFQEEPAKTVAAITFGGFANDEKIEKYKQELVKYLGEVNIEHNSKFSFFGYNSPYDLINRRNEVIVEIPEYKTFH